jgi:hypothetical protein
MYEENEITEEQALAAYEAKLDAARALDVEANARMAARLAAPPTAKQRRAEVERERERIAHESRYGQSPQADASRRNAEAKTRAERLATPEGAADQVDRAKDAVSRATDEVTAAELAIVLGNEGSETRVLSAHRALATAKTLLKACQTRLAATTKGH